MVAGQKRDEGAAPRAGGDARLNPIAHLTLYERVYEELRNAIMGGLYASGETLTIRGLAAQLGTSAMPAREALRRLATEGAVEVLPNRSIRVLEADAARVQEILHLRMLLEGDAAAQAARKIMPAELQAVRSCHREFLAGLKGRVATRLLLAGRDFHFTIYEAARAPTTLALIRMLWLQSGPWYSEPLRRTFEQRSVRSNAEAVAAHHQRLLEALEARDAAAAAAAVRAELADAAEYMRTIVGEPGAPAPAATAR